MTTAMKLNGSV